MPESERISAPFFLDKTAGEGYNSIYSHCGA